MSRKNKSFRQLVRYINDWAEQSIPPILHNISSIATDIESIVSEFEDNVALCPDRKKWNYLFHEVLSFSEKDTPSLNSTIIADLVYHYLELRAPNALGYARFHLDCSNPHVHIMLSANEIGSSKKLRLSKQEFDAVKRRMEEYQRERYPLLEHSLVFKGFGRQNEKKQWRKESEMMRRLEQSGEKLTKKERVALVIHEQLQKSRSLEALEKNLAAEWFELYQRGKQYGVMDTESKKKYRLKTLGLAEAMARMLGKEKWRGR